MDNHINHVRSQGYEKNFKMKCNSENSNQKSTWVFFGSWSEILKFLKYFLKSKSQTNDRFSR